MNRTHLISKSGAAQVYGDITPGNRDQKFQAFGTSLSESFDTQAAVPPAQMILDKGEFLICSGFCSLMYYEQENPGMLYLTNYKLLFEAGAGGPNPYTAYYEGLTTVWNVHSGMTSRFLEGKREFLTIEGARGRFVFRVIDAPTWADKIVTAKKNLPPPPPPSQSSSTRPIPSPLGLGAQTPVVVNVQAPQAPQIMMHCRHCGNLYDATKGRCDKCGAPTT